MNEFMVNNTDACKYECRILAIASCVLLNTTSSVVVCDVCLSLVLGSWPVNILSVIITTHHTPLALALDTVDYGWVDGTCGLWVSAKYDLSSLGVRVRV